MYLAQGHKPASVKILSQPLHPELDTVTSMPLHSLHIILEKIRDVNECRNWYSNIRIGYSNIRMIYTSMPNRPITMTYLVVHVLKI